MPASSSGPRCRCGADDGRKSCLPPRLEAADHVAGVRVAEVDERRSREDRRVAVIADQDQRLLEVADVRVAPPAVRRQRATRALSAGCAAIPGRCRLARGCRRSEYRSVAPLPASRRAPLRANDGRCAALPPRGVSRASVIRRAGPRGDYRWARTPWPSRSRRSPPSSHSEPRAREPARRRSCRRTPARRRRGGRGAGAWACRAMGELEHRDVAVGVAGGEERAAARPAPDPDRLLRPVVEVVGLSLVRDHAPGARRPCSRARWRFRSPAPAGCRRPPG